MKTYKCNECGKTSEMHFGQHFSDRGIVWWESYRCTHCKNAYEVDETGIPPSSLRDYLLETKGRWKILFSNDAKMMLRVLIVFKKIFKLSMARVSELKIHHLEGLVSGTRIEMQWIQLLLLKNGIGTQITQADTLHPSLDLSVYFED